MAGRRSSGVSAALARVRLVSFALAALVLTGCDKPEAKAEQSPDPIPVTIVAPEAEGVAEAAARYPATIARDREANLSFRVGGTIEALSVRIGERIGLGGEIARLDATPYQAARIRSEEEVARIARAAMRSRELVPAGAVARSVDEDNASALQAARAALRNARYDESSSVVRSPFTGVVLARHVEVGETVTAGQTIVRMADLGSPLIARAAVPQVIATAIGAGDPAEVLAGQAAPLQATVRHVGAAADFKTGTIEIELTLPANAGLPSGLTASVVFPSSGERQPVQRLPAEALLDADRGQGHVYIVDPHGSVARRVTVKLEGFDGEALRVSGLDPAARVITYGAGFVRDGQKVAVSRQ